MTSIASVSSRPRTRVAEVHAEIRDAILGGRLKPGERLSPGVIAQDSGVSLSVVREALTRLAEQGLVLARPRQGFQVIDLSREDLLDLTATRLDIETLAARRSVERGDVGWRADVLAAHYKLEHTPQFVEGSTPPVLTEEWARAHEEFHHLLLAACGSNRLLDIAETLRTAAEVYRRWSTPMAGTAKRDIAGEHRAILEAVQAGDAELAAKNLATHISHTTDVLIEHAS